MTGTLKSRREILRRERVLKAELRRLVRERDRCRREGDVDGFAAAVDSLGETRHELMDLPTRAYVDYLYRAGEVGP